MATHSGVIHACGHFVEFWYEWDGRTARATPELFEQLDEEAEGRAREMIAQDYTSGELNATDKEIRGWWKI